jgi:ectoine hydroxylase-related dioxygenase (phytanoyl-CoA dioxygenase family)
VSRHATTRIGTLKRSFNSLRAGLESDLDAVVQAAPPGISDPVIPFMTEFYGRDTVRLDGLPAKSKTFIDVLTQPLLLAAADHFLLPTCARYTYNTGQLIEIRPGETAQTLHRDEDAWLHFPRPRPEIEVEALFALSDFTVENGATQVVPGSHRWPADRAPKPEEIVQADMPAGSALIYLGSVLHGGGANRTTTERRRAVFLGYCLGWLRTEENTFLSVPIEDVRRMPRKVQELLGYEPHIAIGVVNVSTPMKLLQ